MYTVSEVGTCTFLVVVVLLQFIPKKIAERESNNVRLKTILVLLLCGFCLYCVDTGVITRKQPLWHCC